MKRETERGLIGLLLSMMGGGAGGFVAGAAAQHETDRADLKNIPGRVLAGTNPVPPISKDKLAEIAADKPEAWDRLLEVKKWITEVEALAAERRDAKNSVWQERLNSRPDKPADLPPLPSIRR
jgi:hypothetical protein